MPTEPAQIAIVIFEISLLLFGAGLALWLVFNPGTRARWLGTNALPVTPASLTNFVLITVLIFLTGFAFQAAAQLWVGPIIASATDQQGLQRQRTELAARITAAEAQLNEVKGRGPARRSQKTVTIRVAAERAGPLDLTVAYAVPGAS
ncbi:MAG TPA: hypothetical protein PLQ52_07565, partial [Lacunisphaera sp.]|nr:hypothetical protein [Lacunisphaera sp.]